MTRAMEMLLPVIAYFLYTRSQAEPDGQPPQDAIQAFIALIRDIRQTIESRRLQAMAEITMIHARQFSNEGILILDAIMHSLDYYYNETQDIKQYRLRRTRELGIITNLHFLSTVGVRPHHLVVDATVRASDVSVAPRERDVAGLFANNMSSNWAQAYSSSVQLMQQEFYSDDLRFTEARTSWAQIAQSARSALQL